MNKMISVLAVFGLCVSMVFGQLAVDTKDTAGGTLAVVGGAGTWTNLAAYTNDAGYITDAPSDDTQYIRFDATWQPLALPSESDPVWDSQKDNYATTNWVLNQGYTTNSGNAVLANDNVFTGASNSFNEVSADLISSLDDTGLSIVFDQSISQSISGGNDNGLFIYGGGQSLNIDANMLPTAGSTPNIGMSGDVGRWGNLYVTGADLISGVISSDATEGTQIVNYQTMTNWVEGGGGGWDGVYRDSSDLKMVDLTTGKFYNENEFGADVWSVDFLNRQLGQNSSMTLDWGTKTLSTNLAGGGVLVWMSEGTATTGTEIVNYQTMTGMGYLNRSIETSTGDIGLQFEGEAKYYVGAGYLSVGDGTGLSLQWSISTLKDDANGVWKSEGTATNGNEIVNYQTMTNWVATAKPIRVGTHSAAGEIKTNEFATAMSATPQVTANFGESIGELAQIEILSTSTTDFTYQIRTGAGIATNAWTIRYIAGE